MRETIKISNLPLVVNAIRFYMSVKVEFMAFVKRTSEDVRGCVSALIHRETQRDYFIAIICHVFEPIVSQCTMQVCAGRYRIPFTWMSMYF